jgi:hypothetical protein
VGFGNGYGFEVGKVIAENIYHLCYRVLIDILVHVMIIPGFGCEIRMIGLQG